MSDDPARQTGIERRPIAARRFHAFRAIALKFAAWRVSANAISVASMTCAGGAAILLALTQSFTLSDRLFFAGAAALIQLRLLANLLDGLVAVEGGRRSPTGELFNEVPDRVSDTLILVGAGYATASSPTLGWLAALMALFVSYVRLFGRSLGFAGDYRGPMAKPHRMFVITMACVLMAVLPERWALGLPAIGDSVTRGSMWMALALIVIGCLVTAVRRLRRIASAMNATGQDAGP